MLQISAELLAMSSDAAVLIKNHKVVFANSEACMLLGHDCIGKSVKAVFGGDIAEIQAGSYIGDFPVGSKRYVLRANASDGVQVIFISPLEVNDSLISEAFIFSLRNSLMSVDVALSLLRSHAAQNPELSDSLKIISHESYRLNRILSNVSIIRSIKSEQIPFVPVEMDIVAFVKQLIDSVNFFIGGPEITFHAEKEIKIYADPSLIEGLVLNLISNCLIHSKNCSRISVNLVQGKENCFICIDDNGCGIEPEKLHTVFNRYMHHYELSDMNHGSGLGLSAARAIAKLHCGTIMIESRPDIGTAVRVSLAHRPYPAGGIGQPQSGYQQNMKSLLTGLVDCLPADFFADKYLD